MTKRLYVHIGMHKTGTTSIQNFCWNNRFILKKFNLLYPELGLSGPTHAHFALCLKSDRQRILQKIATANYLAKDSPYQEYVGSAPDTLYEQLGEIVNETSCDSVLLSSECFLEWLNPEDIAYLIDKYVHCNVKIIIYLRRQDRWIQAVFNQIVKDPHIRYAGKLEEMPQVQMMDYYKIISKWANSFGRENIIVKIYKEISLLDSSNIVEDFLKNFALQTEDLLEFPYQSEVANISIDPNGLKILQSLNQHHVSDSLYRKVLNALLNLKKINYKMRYHSVLNFEDAIRIYERYERSNEYLSKEYFNGVQLFNPPSKDEYIKSTLSLEDIFSKVLVHIFESKRDIIDI